MREIRPWHDSDMVTLYLGDCLDVVQSQDWGERFGGEPMAVVSDPPYGMAWDTETVRFSGGNNPTRRTAGRNDNRAVANDDKPFDPAPWLIDGYEAVVLWGANHYAQRLPVGTTLVWIKRNDEAFGSFLSDAEIAWQRGGHGVYCRRDFSMNAETLRRAHPTQKPVSLMAWCISRLNLPKETIILDPYCGSGSTLVAAKSLGYRSVGIDVHEGYLATALERTSQEVLAL
jgi:site-specific DNA-methyltransferase (adenine-specific)